VEAQAKTCLRGGCGQISLSAKLCLIAFAVLTASSRAYAFLIPVHQGITDTAYETLSLNFPKLVRNLTARERDEIRQGTVDGDVVEGGLAPGSTNDPRVHFDNLADYESIYENFRAVLILVRQNVLKARRDPWEFGKLLHSAQDFYSHSNYVPLFRAYAQRKGWRVGSIPTIEEVLLNPTAFPGFPQELSQLRTGYWPNKSTPPKNDSDHGYPIGPGLHKDSLQRDFYIEAKRTAEIATEWYLRLYLKDLDAWQECERIWDVKF